MKLYIFRPDITVTNKLLQDVTQKKGRILLSGSSQGESSVMRVRLEGRKKPIMNTISPL